MHSNIGLTCRETFPLSHSFSFYLTPCGHQSAILESVILRPEYNKYVPVLTGLLLVHGKVKKVFAECCFKGTVSQNFLHPVFYQSAYSGPIRNFQGTFQFFYYWTFKMTPECLGTQEVKTPQFPK